MVIIIGIMSAHCEMSPWRSNLPDNHSQIDMLIDRDDRIINICEIKFSSDPFAIDKEYEELRDKINSFVVQTVTKKVPHLTLITPYGLKPRLSALTGTKTSP